MKKNILLLALSGFLFLSLSAGAPGFMENKGQVTDDKGNPRNDVLFTLHRNNLKMFIRKTGISYQFLQQGPRTSATPVVPHTGPVTEARLNTWRVDVELQGANPHPEVVSEEEVDYHENYYLANLSHPLSDVKCYRKIIMKDVYPGIDWVLMTDGTSFKYEFHVHASGNAARIRLDIQGATGLRINEEGELVMETGLGTLKEDKPVMLFPGAEPSPSLNTGGDFRLSGNQLSFSIPGYQEGMEIIIDPSLTWSTYFGGGDSDDAEGTDIDPNGFIYITGYTYSTSGISTGGFQNTYGGASDGFVTKFSPSGTPAWSTYFGGNQYENFYEVKAHTASEIYVAGITSSTSGMTLNAHQSTYGGGSYDGLVFKLDGSGNLIWSTYYGGGDDDRAVSIATDRSGRMYFVGMSRSNTGIAFNGFQNAWSGNYDSYIARFTPSGTRVWASYYGGSVTDAFLGIDTDRDGNVYTIGYTDNAPNLAFNGYQMSYGGGINDALLVKFDSSGNRIWATYYGGSGHDDGRDVHVDTLGNLYVTGYTASSNAMGGGGHQNTFGGFYDVFLAKFTTAGTRVWGSYYGGTGDDRGFSLDGDADGNIVGTGWVNSTSQVAFNAFHQAASGGGSDAYLARFFSNGTIDFGTYFGGTASDFGEEVAVGPSKQIALTGSANSANAIANNGYQNSPGGNGDCFLALFQLCPNVTPPTIAPTGVNHICDGDSIVLTASRGTGIVWSNNATTSSVTVDTSGVFTVRFDTAGCSYTSQPTVVTWHALPAVPHLTPAGPFTFCAGDSVVLHSDGIGFNHWSNGATADSIAVYTSGSYSVFVTDFFGCASDTSASVQVNVGNPAPTPAISPAGDTLPICQGSSLTLTSSSPIRNRWNNGDTTASILVSLNGYYSVYVSDPLGCNSGLDSVYVRIIPAYMANLVLPDDSFCTSDPAFTLTGGTPAGGTYTGNFVSGGMFDPGAAGAGMFTLYYNYTDTLSGCSSADSQLIFVDVCLSNETFAGNGFRFWPNPTSGELFVQHPFPGALTVRICAITGALVQEHSVVSGQSIRLQGLAPGIYQVVAGGQVAKIMLR